MAQKKVYRARTAVADKNGELISAGTIVTPDQFENDVFNRLMSPELRAIVKGEASDDDDGYSPDEKAIQLKSRESAFNALNRKGLDDVKKIAGDMKEDGYTMPEFDKDATKAVYINAILDANEKGKAE